MTCTCTVEDENGRSITLWDGSAFMSQCPGSADQIVLLHSQFAGRQPIECGDRISVVPINQVFQNYTLNATITVSTSNNGSSMRCSVGGPPPVGMIVLNVGGGLKSLCSECALLVRCKLFRNSPCSK